MKRKLIALLLCIAMIGSMTIYAVGDESTCTCGAENEAHAEECALYEAVETTEATETTEPVADDDVAVEETTDVEYVVYTDTAASGVVAQISAPEGAFSEDATVNVKDTTVAATQLAKSASGTIEGSVAVDISFGGEQPSAPVEVQLVIPENKIPDSANQVQIIHMTDAGPEVCGTFYLNGSEDETITFTTEGFSTYVAVFINGKYSSQKMSDFLKGNTRYSIKEFPVDIFDYDPATINAELNAIPSDGKGFHFTGYNITGCGSNNGINNSTADFAKQGILASTLVNGLPDINYIGNTSTGADGGVESGKVLFSATECTSAKTIYNDIPFEFIYDNQTGFYTYKSSANHAQLNDAGTRVELYADTLSTQNAYLATLTPQITSGTSDMGTPTVSGNSLTATVVDSAPTATTRRLDPYVPFVVPEGTTVKISEIGFIYVKAKVPASVGSNEFQLFVDFTTSGDKHITHNETNTKKVAYTPNGDWVEFLIDASDIPDWSGTLNNVRVDLFDSNKGTVDVDGKYPVEIAQVSLIKKGVDDYVTRGGYYPFSKINESYPGNNSEFTFDFWQDLLLDVDNITARATRSINNPSPKQASDMYSQLAYGTVMEFDFYIPVDKSGEDLTYLFDGDDDLWVFVDGELALDIGGGHGAITGSLNFTSGEVSVASAQQVTGYDTGIDTTAKGTVSRSWMKAEQYTPGKHTMKVFYLERGGSVSNCFMKFNLPQTPQGSVSVTKEVTETTGASLSALKQEDFEFTIETQDMGAGNNAKAPLANKDFYIVNADDTVLNAETDANGKFFLKDGQKAVFEIAENYNVTVTETPNDIAGYGPVATTYNDTDANTGTQLTEKNTEKKFAFVNTYTELKVTFTYVPVNPAVCPDNKKGTVELTGDVTTKTYEVEGVSEEIGMRVGVPAGSTATDNAYIQFVGWYSDEKCETLISNDPVFVPSKDANSNLWETATYYAKFEFKNSDLTITKSGIEEVDHRPLDSDGVNDQQTSIFEIKGTTYAGDSISLTIAIVGNDSVTIRELPVGTYTVKEIADWSWRYEPAEASQVIDLSGIDETVEFTNSRQNSKWLSGDSWCKNFWKDGTFTAVES